VRDQLADLVLGHTIGERALRVTLELLRPVHRRQRGHRDQAAIALGQSGALPDIAEQNLLRQVDELRDDSADFVAGG
jgi:hypothetical protein